MKQDELVAVLQYLVYTRPCIVFAPSKLSWFFSGLLNNAPYYRQIREHEQLEKMYELAKRAAKLDFSIRVLDSGWATQRCLTDDSYRTLTRELFEIDKIAGSGLASSIPPSLHWSRRYEYPYVVINSKLRKQPAKEFKILDCGAGVGPLQFYLAMKGHEYYSLDLDLSALMRVARFKSKNGLKTLYPTYGNILDVPFPNNYFDRIVCISVLEHIIYPLRKDIDVVLKGFVNELLRVLKPEGLFVLTFDVNMNPQRSIHRLYYNEYESLCEILGITSEPPPQDRLCSSDTEEGRMMGEDLCIYSATITHDTAD